MCGRLSQYSAIHDFVAALSMPNALANSVGELPLGENRPATEWKLTLLMTARRIAPIIVWLNENAAKPPRPAPTAPPG